MAFGDFISKFDPTTKSGRENLLPLAFGLSGFAARGLMRKKRLAEEGISKSQSALEESLANIPTYQIPDEVKQYMAMQEQAAQSLEGVRDLAGEATDIARSRTNMAEAPGAGIAREDIRQSTAATAQRAVEAGGGSASTLGAITQTGLSEQAALRDLGSQTQQYRSQAELDLMNALRSEAGISADITATQAGLRGAGLQTMIGQKGIQQESELSKYLTGVQYDTQQLANLQTELENMKNRRASLLSSGISAAGNVAGALI